VLARFHRGTSPGLTALTYEHILDATRRPSARQACIATLNDILANRLPQVPQLLDSDGLPLRKPAGGIRPIAIGEAWLRLAALCTVHECNDLGPSRAPLQLRVGSSGESKMSAIPSARPSTHTPTIYSCTWTAKVPATVSRARQSFTQPMNTPPHSFLFSPGRTAAVAGFPPRGATRLLPGPLHQRLEAGGPARQPPFRSHALRTLPTRSHGTSGSWKAKQLHEVYS
jgi:hypothetical protein